MHKSRWCLLITMVSLIAISVIAWGIKYQIPASRRKVINIETFVLNSREIECKAVEYAPNIGFELRYMYFHEAELMPIEEYPSQSRRLLKTALKKYFYVNTLVKYVLLKKKLG